VRALVTGAGGFAGQWLCAELLSDGWDVHGATLTGAPAGGTLEDWQRDAVYWHDVDLRDQAEVGTVLDAARPDAVFHLAGVSYLPDAGADPSTAWSTNVLAAVFLLDGIATRKQAGVIDPVVVIAGSGEQYGPHPESELPLDETAALQPASVYAATKVAQESAALASWRATGTRVIAARPFNHSGPGQASTFLLPALVQRALDAHEKKLDAIPIGNSASVRDFLHVDDVVRAYIYLARRGVPGEAYNICSGTGTSVADLVQMVLDEVARTMRVRVPGPRGAVPAHTVRAVPDPGLMRPADLPVLIGNPAKLMAATTWKPNHTLEMLIQDLIDAAAY
jgi:GDP-4-dehydro-6-deoxy-D-mannose reductase